MMTIINETLSTELSDKTFDENALALSEQNSQLLLPSKFITHTTKSGLNPLVDAAAYLFSAMGKLKALKSYRHLSKLRSELIEEINNFQDAAKSQGYSSEYILVTRYALCATLDDIISNTAWGAQGQWDAHNLMSAFNQESAQQERFFVILERLIKDPELYIDIMEFMYLCLSLGFKGSYRSTEFNSNQLEQITNALYKRIRAYRGDFNKMLSPFPIRAPLGAQKSAPKPLPAWLIALISASACIILFAGMRYILTFSSHQAYQDLTRLGQTQSYETLAKTSE